MLLNIDPKYRSSLHSIQLATVCRTELIEKYPINEILEPFMSSIKCLERVSYETCMHHDAWFTVRVSAHKDSFGGVLHGVPRSPLGVLAFLQL